MAGYAIGVAVGVDTVTVDLGLDPVNSQLCFCP